MSQPKTDDLDQILDHFDVNNLYNYVFRHLTHMIEHNTGRTLKIFYCEKDDSNSIWRLWNVSPEKEFDNPDFKPIELLLHWTPNKYDAGSIFRVIVAKIRAYQGDQYGGSERDAPRTPPPDTPDKDKITPGTG